MSKLLALFRKPRPVMRPAVGRSLRGLSVADRLDLSLRLGYCDGRVYAWGY